MSEFSSVELRIILDAFATAEALAYLEDSEAQVRDKVAKLLEDKLAQ